jgi:hypothetical protein
MLPTMVNYVQPHVHGRLQQTADNRHSMPIVFPKQAYFAAARFLDSLTREGVDFRGGADFQHASFVGDVAVTNALRSRAARQAARGSVNYASSYVTAT